MCLTFLLHLCSRGLLGGGTEGPQFSCKRNVWCYTSGGGGWMGGKVDEYKMYLLLPSWLQCKRNQWLWYSALCSGSTPSSSWNCCILGLFIGKTSTRWGMSIEQPFCQTLRAQHSLLQCERERKILASSPVSASRLFPVASSAALLCSTLCPAGLQLTSTALLWSWNSHLTVVGDTVVVAWLCKR